MLDPEICHNIRSIYSGKYFPVIWITFITSVCLVYVFITFNGAFRVSEPVARLNCSEMLKSNFLFITVKSTATNYVPRLSTSLKTWIPFALGLRAANGRPVVSEVTVVTDRVSDSASTLNGSGGRKVNVISADQCGKSHKGWALTCKLQEELRSYFKPRGDNAAWFCHFDDDVYVNVPNLIAALQKLGDPFRTEWYVGKMAAGCQHGSNVTWGLFGEQPARMFQWLTGQTLCLSHRLMLRMKRLIQKDWHNYNLLRAAVRSNMGDDITLALFVIDVLKIPPTQIEEMYTQYDNMTGLTRSDLDQAIVLPHYHLDAGLSRLWNSSEPDRNTGNPHYSATEHHKLYRLKQI